MSEYDEIFEATIKAAADENHLLEDLRNMRKSEDAVLAERAAAARLLLAKAGSLHEAAVKPLDEQIAQLERTVGATAPAAAPPVSVSAAPQLVAPVVTAPVEVQPQPAAAEVSAPVAEPQPQRAVPLVTAPAVNQTSTEDKKVTRSVKPGSPVQWIVGLLLAFAGFSLGMFLYDGELTNAYEVFMTIALAAIGFGLGGFITAQAEIFAKKRNKGSH